MGKRVFFKMSLSTWTLIISIPPFEDVTVFYASNLRNIVDFEAVLKCLHRGFIISEEVFCPISCRCCLLLQTKYCSCRKQEKGERKRRSDQCCIYTRCSFVDFELASGDLRIIWVPTWICSLCERYVSTSTCVGRARCTIVDNTDDTTFSKELGNVYR